MEAPGIRLEQRNHVVVIELDRPPANVIDLSFAVELEALLARLEHDDRAQALVVTGSKGAFSAGLDLKRVPYYGQDEQAAMVIALNRLFGRLYGFPRPTVSAVNGHAIAGGLVMALTCDYRVGADNAYQLGLAEVRVGVPYPVAAMAVVQAELPAPVARRLILQGTSISPDKALVHGLLDELQPQERLLERAVEIAEGMAHLPGRTFGRIKRQLRAATLAGIENAISHASDPMLQGWLDAETPKAAETVLRG